MWISAAMVLASTLNAGISTKCSLLFFTCVSHEVDQGAYLWQLRRRQWEQEKEKRCGIRIFAYYRIGPSGFTSFHLTPSPKRLSNLWLFSSKHSIPTYGDYKTGRWLWAGKVAQWVKAPALVAWAWSTGLTWWKESANSASCPLPSTGTRWHAQTSVPPTKLNKRKTITKVTVGRVFWGNN